MKPAPPLSLKASALSPFEIELTWRESPGERVGYTVERSVDGKNFRQIARLLPRTTRYRNASLFPDRRYYFRVRAFNATGCSPSPGVVMARTKRTQCQLAVTDWVEDNTEEILDDLTNAVALASGGAYAMALRSDGTIAAWGDDSGGNTELSTGLTNVVAIAAGEYHRLALRENGTVVAWGVGEQESHLVTKGLSNVVAVAAGGNRSLALMSDGTVAGWNSAPNATGGTLFGWGGSEEPPVNLIGVVAIAQGRHHGLALLCTGRVVGWGLDDYGQASPPYDLEDVVAIDARGSLSVALRRNGTIVQWGGLDVETPSGLSNIVSVSLGETHGVALRGDGTVATWSYSGDERWPRALTGVVAVEGTIERPIVLTTIPNPPRAFFHQVLDGLRIRFGWVDRSGGIASHIIERSGETGADGYPTNWLRIGFTAPVNPPYLSAYALTNRAFLRWGDFDAGATGVQLDRAPDVNGVPGAWERIVTRSVASPFDNQLSDAGLPANSSWWYRVRLTNGLGISPASDAVKVDVLPPRRPTLPFLYVGDTNQLIGWFQRDDSVAQEGFIIEQSTNLIGEIGDWTEFLRLANNGFEATFTNHQALLGVTYSYRVRAFNFLGESSASVVASMTIAPQLPIDISSVTADNHSAGVSWVRWPAQGFFRQFTLERAPDESGAPGDWQHVAIITNNDVARLAFDYWNTGLAGPANYWYRVRAANWLGETPPGQPDAVEIRPPIAPQQLLAEIGLSNRVELEWRHYEGRGRSGFVVERAAEIGSSGWVELATMPVAAQNQYRFRFSDTNAALNSICRYRVRAFNAIGFSEYSEAVSLNVSPPEAPELSALARSGDIFIVVTPRSAGAQRFRLQRAPDLNGVPGSWMSIGTFWAVPRSYPDTSQLDPWGRFTDSTAAEGKTFWYRALSYNWAGASAYSVPVAGENTTAASTALESVATETFRPRLTSITVSGHDVVIAWSAVFGTMVVVEASSQSNSGFAPVSDPVFTSDTGAGKGTGRFTDSGALTNAASRFYRIRLVP